MQPGKQRLNGAELLEEIDIQDQMEYISYALTESGKDFLNHPAEFKEKLQAVLLLSSAQLFKLGHKCFVYSFKLVE